MEKYIKNILIKRISLFFDLNLTKDYSLELMKEGRNNDLYKVHTNKEYKRLCGLNNWFIFKKK